MAQASNQTPEFAQYNQAEQITLAQAVAFAILYFQVWQEEEVSDTQWYSLVQLLFPYVKEFRDTSSRNARRYYDGERSRFLFKRVLNAVINKVKSFGRTPIPEPAEDEPERHPVNLANYRPEWLQEALEPVREKFKEQTTSDADVRHAAAIVGNEALNGGRRTVMQAVPDDPLKPKWARVQGGNESCAFCWMLISRGPVYRSEQTALGNQGGFHPNCDCRVVPVFDEKADWPGKDDWRAAEDLWKESTKGLSGWDMYKAFRRALGDGVKGPGRPELPVPKAA